MKHLLNSDLILEKCYVYDFDKVCVYKNLTEITKVTDDTACCLLLCVILARFARKLRFHPSVYVRCN